MIGEYRWVEGRTSLGRRFWYVEPVVPRVVKEILQSVVYLYPTVAGAQAGASAGGTGFFTSVPTQGVPSFEDAYDADAEPEHLYVVTAGHVIRRGKASVVRVNTESGLEIIDLPLDAWIHHPDGADLAIAPVGRLAVEAGISLLADHGQHAVGHISHRLYLYEEEAALAVLMREGPGSGDECFFVGRFITHEGRIQNRPTVRFGNLAMMHGETIRDEESGLEQESFLVEARSLSGYSGSPVFIYSAAGMRPDGSVSPFVRSSVRFLGVDWCHLQKWERVYEADRKTVSEPKQWVRQNTGMAGVVPAWKLIELLNSEEVTTMRKQESEKRQKEREQSPGGVQLDSADDSEFERFKSLARRLVEVPKKELDEKRKDES